MTESFAQLFEQSLASQRIRPGQILSGLIVDVGDDMVIVNVGLDVPVRPEASTVNKPDAFESTRATVIALAPEIVRVLAPERLSLLRVTTPTV